MERRGIGKLGVEVLRRRKGRALMVTGTGTGVGKTVVAGGLALGFRELGLSPGVFKPAESGVEDEPKDGVFLKRCAKAQEPLSAVVLYRLKAPLAPAVAAEMEGMRVDLAVIEAKFKEWVRSHPITIVEGAGGLLVPLVDNVTYADLAKLLGLPLLIVARPSLGTINHTLLTVSVARAIGLRILGVVISGYPEEPGLAEETSPAVIEKMGHVEILGLIPRIPGLSTESSEMGGLNSYPWGGLAKRVWKMLAD